MNRRQRRAHARMWPLLAIILVAVSAGALVAKARIGSAAAAIAATIPGE